MRWFLIVAALAVGLLVGSPAWAQEEKRVALVVGNGAYLNTSPLPNPPNDARGMATALRQSGFQVLDGIDLDRQGMERLIRQFAREIRDAEVALFFYAGHGLQVEGRNYLVPVDAALEDEADLPFEAIVMEDLQGVFGSRERTNLIFLDACRDNPLARSLARSMGVARSAAIGRGLAQMQAGVGTLIAYATAPDAVALDGEGENSPFTTALLTHISQPGLEVRQLMTSVRNQVMEDTGGQQVPWDHSSLRGPFYFHPPAPEASDRPSDETLGQQATISPLGRPMEAAPSVIEVSYWEGIQRIDTPAEKIAALRRYLERFPDGNFVELAEIQIASLEATATAPTDEAERDRPYRVESATATPVVTPPPVDPVAAEASLGLGRSDRRTVQRALTLLGFDTRGVDGVIGPNSRTAIVAYQRARSLQPASGYLMPEHHAYLMEEAAGLLAAFQEEQRRIQESRQGNSCQWANDGECDESRYYGNVTGACPAGTDSNDCRGLQLRSSGEMAGNSCQWAFDGECDEPGIGTGVCAAGTDAADCRRGGGGGGGDAFNSCQWAYDGECDEPGIGTGACPVGTDAADCRR